MAQSPQKPTSTATTQEEVVDAAFRMIDAQGYAKFSIRALAEELGIGTRNVYTYVPSKKQLLFYVLQKMQSEIDNAPIAGEFWEDTLHRTCGSILRTNLAHPNIRIVQMQTQIETQQKHRRNIYYLHTDQGMSDHIYETMYSVLRSYLSGFIDMAVKRKLKLTTKAEDQYAGGRWTTISDADTDIEMFHQGIDFIIAGTRAMAAPDPCNWRTPEDPATWTWGKE